MVGPQHILPFQDFEMFRYLRTQLIVIMFATGLTPIIVLGLFCFYIDYYGIPDTVREGLAAIPFLSSFVDRGEAYFRLIVYVSTALVGGVAIGVCGVLTARSITSPIEETRRMIEIIGKGEPLTTFKHQQGLSHNEIGMLLRLLINAVQTIRLKQDEIEKKLLYLQEMDRFKTEFISNITCELRTPLTLILGPVTSLLETAAQAMSEEDVSFLKIIRDNALRLKKSVYNLVAFSNIEAGGEQPSVPLKELGVGTRKSRVEIWDPRLRTQDSMPMETDGLALQQPKLVLERSEGDEDGVTHKCSILIMEDSADMKKYLYSLLKENFEPIFAGSEHEAMERIKEMPVKLVIIDVAITGMDSYELCRKVKERVSPLFIPVVIITARGGTTMRIKGLEAGADCYITKPFEKRELLARLKTLSAQKELFDSIHEKNIQLHQAEKLRSEFVATMSHELRTPLSSILLASELLLDEISGKVNEEQKRQLGIIRLSCQNLLRLINNVLTLSKINAGKMDTNIAEINLNKLIDNVLREISPLANEKGLHLQSNLCKIPVMMSDGDKVRQVLLNILSNAIKFTPFGGEIGISARLPNGHKIVEISIADTGVGIPHDALDSVFEEYKQIRVAENRNIEGVGLGLSITKKLVKLLGGEIWVRSKLGEGSVFSFTLPQRSEIDIEPLNSYKTV